MERLLYKKPGAICSVETIADSGPQHIRILEICITVCCESARSRGTTIKFIILGKLLYVFRWHQLEKAPPVDAFSSIGMESASFEVEVTTGNIRCWPLLFRDALLCRVIEKVFNLMEHLERKGNALLAGMMRGTGCMLLI